MTHHTDRHGSHTTGFTLIEMVMALVVFGVILSTALYRMSPALDSARVNRVAALMAADFQYAQVVAARQRRPVVVLVSPAVQAYEIRDSRSATVFRQRFVGPGTDFGMDIMTSSLSTIEIFPNGATVQSVTLTVGLGGRSRTVQFTRAGQIRVTN